MRPQRELQVEVLHGLELTHGASVKVSPSSRPCASDHTCEYNYTDAITSLPPPQIPAVPQRGTAGASGSDSGSGNGSGSDSRSDCGGGGRSHAVNSTATVAASPQAAPGAAVLPQLKVGPPAVPAATLLAVSAALPVLGATGQSGRQRSRVAPPRQPGAPGPGQACAPPRTVVTMAGMGPRVATVTQPDSHRSVPVEDGALLNPAATSTPMIRSSGSGRGKRGSTPPEPNVLRRPPVSSAGTPDSTGVDPCRWTPSLMVPRFTGSSDGSSSDHDDQDQDSDL